MSDSLSPFHLLTKTYANHMLTREQYVKIRGQLLKKLQNSGKVTEEDLKNFTDITYGNIAPQTEKSYSSSDWVIIFLGLIAAIVLGFILYN